MSRGTVVAAFDQLVEAGVLERRRGAGTAILGRPAWTRGRSESAVASLLLRRVAADRGTIDLSLSVPAGTGHLPAIDWSVPPSAHDGHGLDPQGDPDLRAAVAAHLSIRQSLPTTPEQVLVTAGAQQALSLLGGALVSATTTVIAGCPTYPGFAAAFLAARPRLVTVGVDDAGLDPAAVARAVRPSHDNLVYGMPTGHNPTGAVMPAARRRAVIDAIESSGTTMVEDLTLADLGLEPDADDAEPLASTCSAVVAVGSASKLLWAGLRVGWIRADPPLLDKLIQLKVEHDLATSMPAQIIAARLLSAIDDDWLAAHRRALATRRDRLTALLAEHLPAWRTRPPAAGLSMLLQVPVARTDAFARLAAQHGVAVAPGSTTCACGRHLDTIRLSFAEPLEALDLAAERLASAWEIHSQDLAATPAECAS